MRKGEEEEEEESAISRWSSILSHFRLITLVLVTSFLTLRRATGHYLLRLTPFLFSMLIFYEMNEIT